MQKSTSVSQPLKGCVLSSHLGDVTSFSVEKSSVELLCSHGRVRVSFLSPSLVRVQVAHGDRVYRDHESFSRVPFSEEVSVTVVDESDSISVQTEGVNVRAQKTPFALGVSDPSGDLLLQTLPRGPLMDGDGFLCQFVMPDDARFYGLGEKTGGLDKRGRRYEMWNTDNAYSTIDADPIYQSNPFLIILSKGKACGVFLDNSYRTSFDLGSNSDDSFTIGASGGPFDLYVIAGPSMADVVERYASITGRPRFPPRWALGYQQSRWMTYESERDLLDIAEQFRTRRIPCDTIVLDIEYMNEYRLFTWNPVVFPDPSAFVRKLAKKGFRVMTIIDPGVKVDDSYDMYREGVSKGYFLRRRDGQFYVGIVWPGETVFPDFSRAEVREWFGSKYAGLASCGVSNSSWIDMNEPSNCIYDGLKEEYSMDSVVDSEGRPWEPRLRNVYGLLMANAVFDGLKATHPGQRPFVLTRSGFSGYQRYAATWTGDIHSTWEHLRMSIPMLLNLGLSAVPFCGADVGGFMGDVTPELLARWYQVGCFYPFFRNHSNMNTARQEPWAFGKEIESVSREYVSLRYRLLRYLYSLARHASRTGHPIMRPMAFEFQDDARAQGIEDQFMVGPALLVAPVLEQGSVSRTVYLPAGKWFDFWTDESFEGPREIVVDAPLELLPVYVRGGSVVPMGTVTENTDKNQGDLILAVYPQGCGKFEFYEDDGVSQDGPSATVLFSTESSERSLLLTVGQRKGDWKPPRRKLVFEVRGIVRRPSTVCLDGQEITLSVLRVNDVGSRLRIVTADNGQERRLEMVL
ncbi:MAG: DUF4968 domain-containing protein [Candidatus Thorarchaeota archaeon]|nr:DUF4968 domain-containing protein [Candidatus Thorarchaeota archaeon]